MHSPIFRNPHLAQSHGPQGDHHDLLVGSQPAAWSRNSHTLQLLTPLYSLSGTVFVDHDNQPTILPPPFAGFSTHGFPLLRKTHHAPIHASPLPETKPPFHKILSVTLSCALILILSRIPFALWYMIHSTNVGGIKENLILPEINTSSMTWFSTSISYNDRTGDMLQVLITSLWTRLRSLPSDINNNLVYVPLQIISTFQSYLYIQSPQIRENSWSQGPNLPVLGTL